MHQIAQLIYELSRSRSQYITDRMQPYELKACHAINLSHICGKPGISQDALTRLRHADKSSIARQVASLEEDGFITRVPCKDDKRIMKLYGMEDNDQDLTGFDLGRERTLADFEAFAGVDFKARTVTPRGLNGDYQ